MNKKEMINAIYEKIADKKLTFGCKIKFKRPNTFFHNMYYDWYLTWWSKIIEYKYSKDAQFKNFSHRLWEWEEWVLKLPDWSFIHRKREYEYVWLWWINYRWAYREMIIWHPVMIWDILDYVDDLLIPDWEFLIKVNVNSILKLWKYKRKSIEEQSDECIEYIYNLIK